MIARFGRYEAIEVLGRGGMGVVYRGIDTSMGRTVAVKTVLVDEGLSNRTAELNERLIREVKAAGTLQHPNIVTIYDMGVENGAPYIVMELIQGRGLDKILDERTPPVEESLRILRDTARALDFAHARGVIHRDIKPGNILIATDGTVKLADFGIAKVAGTQTMTGTGVVIGSVPFMAPESLRGEPSSAASDRYSLAVTAYFMMTGRMPFQGEGMATLITAILHAEPRAPREMNPWLPPGVDSVLVRGLAKAAAARFESCVAFVDALEGACRPAAGLAPSPPPQPVAREDLPATTDLPASGSNLAVPKRGLGLAVLGGAALVGIALAGWLMWRAGSKPADPDVPPFSAKREASPPSAPPPSITGKTAATPAPSTASAGAIRENPRDGLRYVWIPPGRFRMGCSEGDAECEADEQPARDVEISRGFWMGQTEVTQEAYQKVRGTNPSGFKGSTLPVERVIWTEASAYCAAAGLRLPTEAEWEYAARGGSMAARYDTLEDVAWFYENSGSKTHPVAQKSPNRFGLYDMLGNVWEWVSDWYDEKYYGSGAGRDPNGPGRGRSRVFRGGSWFNRPSDLRLSNRFRYVPSMRDFTIGFRCAGDLR